MNRGKKMSLPSDQDATGRLLGGEELEELRRVIESGTLTATKGRAAKTFEHNFAALLDMKFAHACSSGTAAIHAAVAAINPAPGDEIITTSITDMGALAPIVYQGAIPVFADVDPATCNVTAATIEPCISARTKAVIVTHLFGCPCEMDKIMQLAARHNIPVIEDCAQAFLAKFNGRTVGTFGAISCFSLQQGKHITCGEGGVVVSNDAELARRMYLFINKGWGYGDANPDHYFLALNYRISELQAAVALAQLEKLGSSVEHRVRAARQLTELIQDIPGITVPQTAPNSLHTFWRYAVRVDGNLIGGGNDKLAVMLKEDGIFTAPRYIKKPAFQCEVFRERRTFGNSGFPFTLARPEAVDYRPERFPGTFEGLQNILVLPFSERFTGEHIQYIAASMKNAVQELGGKRNGG